VTQLPDELVVDVTGPTAAASPADVTDEDADLLPADDVTFIHVSDVRRLLTSVAPEWAEHLSPTLPVVVYVRSNETAAGKVVVQLMPSVTSLDENEVCRLDSRDDTIRHMFAIEHSGGVSSVVFTGAVHNDHLRRRRYQLSITCQSTLAATDPPFTVYLHVQLL